MDKTWMSQVVSHIIEQVLAQLTMSKISIFDKPFCIRVRHEALLVPMIRWTHKKNTQGWYINFNEIHSRLVDVLVPYRQEVSQRDLQRLVDY